MSFDIDKEFFSTLIITIVNITILFFVLKKILFKPVNKFMDDRSKKIEDALKMAEESKKMVEQMQVEYNEKLKSAKEDGNKVIETYKKMAEDEYNTIIENAKKEAKQMVEDTRSQLEAEKELLVKDVKNNITDLILEISEKILKQNIDNDKNRELISEFIKEK